MLSPVAAPNPSSRLRRELPGVHWPSNLRSEFPIGGKARSLLALSLHSFPVPAWFVVLPGERRPAPQSRAFEDLASEIEVALRRLCPANELVAVRSSAQEEDSANHSFAGQFESYLFVKPQDVMGRVLDVWESARSGCVEAYRSQRGVGRASHLPAVIIQRMISSHRAGVAFTADAVSGRRGIVVVSATYGTASTLVSGACNAETYHVDRNNVIVERPIASETTLDPCSLAKSGQVVTDQEILAIAGLARRVQAYFHVPQDIEWAMDSQGGLFLLQARPITSIKDLLDPDGMVRVWDNSNIVESYGGVTTPLTFSFVRNCYAEVYRQFCRLLRVPSATVTRSHSVFRCLLGFMRGHIYYNLLNWYAVLAMLPGYRCNRAFMEQMMGVKEGLPERDSISSKQDTFISRLGDGLRMLASVAALLKEHLVIDKTIARFHQRIERVLGDSRPDLSQYRPEELVALYRSIESQLLSAWDAPLVNDFLAMIFYGVLRQLCAKWSDDGDGNLQNDLLASGGGMISAQPAELVGEMAAMLQSKNGLQECFKTGSRAEIELAMNSFPALKHVISAYLEKFGDRCEDELKLESPTLHDDPLPLYRSIGQLASLAPSSTYKSSIVNQNADQQIQLALHRNPLKRLIFRWVLYQCRRRVRDRENLRFERTRVFGRVRLIFVELGYHLHGLGLLEAPQDIFFLEVDEVLGYVEGTTTCSDLRGLSQVKKAEYERWRNASPPADRFETRGGVCFPGNTFQPFVPVAAAVGEQRKGNACSPGRVRGHVKIIRSTADAPPPGSILVAERTDPSWVLLFPLAAGVLVERGSVLSHVAIVGRELRIPMVTSVPGLTSWLTDGDLVEMDGSSGKVTRIDPQRERSKWIEGDSKKDFAPELLSHEPLPVAPIPDSALLRYGQCWEDADVVCAALDVKRGDTCLSIVSGGDNTLALLAFSPDRLVAVDSNPAQLASLALRVAAFQNLEHAEVLELLGWRPSQRRLQLFLRLRRDLTPAYRKFWDQNLKTIADGAVNAGRFEQYLRFFRRYVLPLIHDHDTVEGLFHECSKQGRSDFYREVWDTWQWRLLFRMFFSQRSMACFGRDRHYFRYAQGSTASRLLDQTRHAIVELPPWLNPYLQWILLGDQATALPFALRKENFEAIRSNLGRLEVRCSSVEEAITGDGPFNRMNLSDVFEYMSAERYCAVLKSIAEKSRSGTRLAYWNMAVERRRPPWLAHRLLPLSDLASRLFPQAKAFFYRDFVVEEVL